MAYRKKHSRVKASMLQSVYTNIYTNFHFATGNIQILNAGHVFSLRNRIIIINDVMCQVCI